MNYTIYASEVVRVNPTFQPYMWSYLGWFKQADIAERVFSARGDRQTAYLFSTRNPNVFQKIVFVNDISP